MNDTFELEVELTTRESAVEITVGVEYHCENNGIGAYEYWGQKCYDRGTNYAEIDSTDFDKEGFTPEEIKEIEAAIEDKLDEWAEKLTENESNNEPDCEPDFDRD